MEHDISSVIITMDYDSLIKENNDLKRENLRLSRYIKDLEESVRYLTNEAAKNC